MLNEHEPKTGAADAHFNRRAEDKERKATGTAPDAPAEVPTRSAQSWHTRRHGDEPRSLAEYVADIPIVRRDGNAALVGAESTLGTI